MISSYNKYLPFVIILDIFLRVYGLMVGNGGCS